MKLLLISPGPLKRAALRRHRVTLPRSLACLLLAALVAAPFMKAAATTDRAVIGARVMETRKDCGYDARGSEDEWHHHNLNRLRLRGRASGRVEASGAQSYAAEPSAARVDDVNDIAVVEDDGTIIAPPSKFDLKNRSLLFTPEAGGYRVSRGDADYNRDFGFRLGYFFGVGNSINSNNGYRDITLRGAKFPFYGVYYDTIFIGTNGFVTFGEGDTSGRISAAALATELPRIAPLWADLDVSSTGNIYYNRLDGRHIITWDGAGQAQYSGASTFQLSLYDDGRIAFVYKNVKARSALIGISPGRSDLEAQPVDLSDPPEDVMAGPFFESFSKQKRLDVPALTRAFYRAYADEFDTIYVWTDFSFDNGPGYAHSFNVRNEVAGIGVRIFDRGAIYGSPARLATVITMGDEGDWPSDPQAHVVGLNSAISIVCHEFGHRWLAYIRFDAEHDIKDDLLGRDDSHWSFLADTRTNDEGSLSSLMEGNSWRDSGNGTFATIESAVNYFSPLDEYLMGLRAADEVGPINYLVTDDQLKQALRERSPTAGFSLSAVRKTTSVAQIVEREGERTPDAAHSRKEFRAAFILLTERGSNASAATVKKIASYRDSLVRYFSVATHRRASLNGSLTTGGD